MSLPNIAAVPRPAGQAKATKGRPMRETEVLITEIDGLLLELEVELMVKSDLTMGTLLAAAVNLAAVRDRLEKTVEGLVTARKVAAKERARQMRNGKPVG